MMNTTAPTAPICPARLSPACQSLVPLLARSPSPPTAPICETNDDHDHPQQRQLICETNDDPRYLLPAVVISSSAPLWSHMVRLHLCTSLVSHGTPPSCSSPEKEGCHEDRNRSLHILLLFDEIPYLFDRNGKQELSQVGFYLDGDGDGDVIGLMVKNLLEAGRAWNERKIMDMVYNLPKEMRQRGCPPGGRTFNALIKLMTSQHMLDDAMRIYKKMI
ncbi:Tetratricopeptide-like helical domain superfamily [Sesbania bispinosa]|nr:Tetratricopeptide-like helical domain superfamily [Sesbania bispinosa]